MIRQYESKDLPQCADIFAKAFSEETWGCVWTKERAEAYLSDLAVHPKFIGFVSEENGVIDGALFACVKVCWNSDEIHIDELLVDPKKQRSGIGGRLVDAVKDYAKSSGLAGIVLYTAEQAPAKKFYEKNGFLKSDGVICMYWV
ncbi:MAG: GNAT family N-acetyltransferase [Oscillospiraceae bacterium]